LRHIDKMAGTKQSGTTNSTNLTWEI
jgi:hypothetical protein